MKQCPMCFQSNPATATVCRCGALLDQPPMNLTRTCPAGLHVMDPTWTVCAFCKASRLGSDDSSRRGDQDSGAPTTRATYYEGTPGGEGPVTLEQPAMSEPGGFAPASGKNAEPSIRTGGSSFAAKTEFGMARPSVVSQGDSLGIGRTSQPVREGRGDSRRKIVGLLVTYTWKPEGECFPVRDGRNWIGRSPDAEVSIAYDPTLSSVNSSIVYREGKFVISDKDSMGGTDVNGKTVWPEQVMPLTNYARIRTGSTNWTFIVIEPAAA